MRIDHAWNDDVIPCVDNFNWIYASGSLIQYGLQGDFIIRIAFFEDAGYAPVLQKKRRAVQFAIWLCTRVVLCCDAACAVDENATHNNFDYFLPLGTLPSTPLT